MAGLGAALAFGHKLGPLPILGAVAVATVLLGFAVWSRVYLSLLGTRWTLFSDNLVVKRPGARDLSIRRSDIAGVRFETISGFGMEDAIYVIFDASGGTLLWTVAKRWSKDELNQLWSNLGIDPVDARSQVRPFEEMPYDRRY